MRQLRRPRCSLLAFVASLAPVSYALASPTYDLVAHTGRQAPGTPQGTTFAMLGLPSMNASGQVVFNASLNNAAPSNDSGIWLDDTLVARAGDAAPGDVPDLRFRAFGTTATPVINDAGMVAFSARPEVPGIAFAGGDFAIWAGRPESLELVAMAGMTAPGFGHSAVFRVGIESGGGVFPAESPAQPRLSDSGQVAFWADVAEDGGIYHGIFAGPPSSAGLVTRGHGQAEKLPAGVKHAILHRVPLVDGEGNALFQSTLEGTGVTTTNRNAIYISSTAADRLLAREDDPVATVPGARWSGNAGRLTLNESGQILFAQELRGVPSATASTLWVARPDEAPRLVARAGEPVPGSPEYRFGGNFMKLYLDDSGRVAFTSRADPADSTASGPLGLWTGTLDDVNLVLLEGAAAAPGAPAGVQINQFRETIAVNANGMLAFTATLKGEGVTSTNNDALFAGTPDDLRLLLREGDLLEVAPGDAREVRIIRFGTSGTSYNSEYLINDSDQVVAAVRFADGSDAIYRITVPEPAALPLLAAMSLLLARNRRIPRRS